MTNGLVQHAAVEEFTGIQWVKILVQMTDFVRTETKTSQKADDNHTYYFISFSEKIRLEVSSESSAKHEKSSLIFFA